MPPRRQSHSQDFSSRASGELQFHFETGKRYRPYISIQRIRSSDIKKQNNNDPRLYYSAKQVPLDQLSVFSLHGGEMQSASLPAPGLGSAVPVPGGCQMPYDAAGLLVDYDTDSDEANELKYSAPPDEGYTTSSYPYAVLPLDTQMPVSTGPSGYISGADAHPSCQVEDTTGGLVESSLVKPDPDIYTLPDNPCTLVPGGEYPNTVIQTRPVYNPVQNPHAFAFAVASADRKPPSGFVDTYCHWQGEGEGPATVIQSLDARYQPSSMAEYFGLRGYPKHGVDFAPMQTSFPVVYRDSTFMDGHWSPYGVSSWLT